MLIGREVFLTMRSLIVTHNIGHSVLEGFENRFAPVVLEDRSQVGLGAVLYAGARIGAEAIVASNSYVVGEIPAGSFAIGVPAKATGSSSHKLSDARRLELARRMIDDLHELLALRGHEVSAIEGDRRLRGRGHARRSSRRATAAASTRRPSCSRSTSAATSRTVSPCSTCSAGASTEAAASCSTPCASSAASAASGSSRGRGRYPGGLV